ncbi:MAG: hypothetical protein MUC84_06020, partial [Solirubrobacteraceae bacterium]|nr:hypothetical protein [Solirubrobacteraceae bacterium]
YIENGNVWLSSPDGAKKVQLTTSGTPAKPWLGVAQAADGRTAAVFNNDPNGNARNQRIKVWDKLGNEIKDLTLQSKNPGSSLIARPIAFEITDDGEVTANEFSYCGGVFPCGSLIRGTWYTTTNVEFGLTPPFETSGARQGTFFGRRLVFTDGSAVSVQRAPNAPFTDDSDPWISPSAGFALKRADIPASGGKVALEVLTEAPAPGQPKNTISVLPYAGDAGTGAVDPANGCDLGAPAASGNAHNVAWSPDGSQIAWRDEQGLKVAGAPVLPWPDPTPCSLSSPPVLITAAPADDTPEPKDASTYFTVSGPSFGGADVGAILAARTPPPPPAPAPAPGPAPGGPTGTGGPAVTPPKAPTGAALAKGLALNVTSTAAGAITARGTIPAKLARRLGLPTTVATGRIGAQRAGQKLTLRLRLTAKARRKAKRLKGVTLTVRITQGGKTTTLRLKLR